MQIFQNYFDIEAAAYASSMLQLRQLKNGLSGAVVNVTTVSQVGLQMGALVDCPPCLPLSKLKDTALIASYSFKAKVIVVCRSLILDNTTILKYYTKRH